MLNHIVAVLFCAVTAYAAQITTITYSTASASVRSWSADNGLLTCSGTDALSTACATDIGNASASITDTALAASAVAGGYSALTGSATSAASAQATTQLVFAEPGDTVLHFLVSASNQSHADTAMPQFCIMGQCLYYYLGQYTDGNAGFISNMRAPQMQYDVPIYQNGSYMLDWSVNAHAQGGDGGSSSSMSVTLEGVSAVANAEQAAAPEPASTALTAFGMMLISWARFRRTKVGNCRLSR